MDISIFLAKVLGLYLLIMGVALILNQSSYKAIFVDLTKNAAFILLTGIIALILGIMMVTVHNVWTTDWRVVVTLLAWLTLVKGCVRVMFPAMAQVSIAKWMSSEAGYKASIILLLILGMFLAYHGYF